MLFSEYERKAAETDLGVSKTYCVLELCGEAGEVADLWKRVERDADGVLTQETRMLVAEELGDCLWAMTRLADKLGTSLENIARANVQKLEKRKSNGTLKGRNRG